MLSLTILWLIIGSILCLMEFVFPSAFVEFMLGVGAFLVAAVSLVVPQFTLQVGLWLIFSAALIILSRRFFTPKRSILSLDDQEAKTLTEIPPGETGRVLYEGNSWQARCADELLKITPNEKVYVVRREGNTLIVLPRDF